jgi:hypothetical protein
MEKEQIINLLDKFIERSERYSQDATDRGDVSDVYYYNGQKKVIEELKQIINR